VLLHRQTIWRAQGIDSKRIQIWRW